MFDLMMRYNKGLTKVIEINSEGNMNTCNGLKE